MRGIIHFDFVHEGTTVNQTFHVEVSKRFIDAVKRKRGDLWRARSLILHPENAPAHSSLPVSQILAVKTSLPWTIRRKLLTGSS
jgi:hypothetical protein